MSRSLPVELPRLVGGPVVLRPFQPRDAGLVVSVAADPLIPLITTVPRSGSADEVAAYLERQHERLRTGVGYSFAMAAATTDEAVGQIGLWTRELAAGRASVGYWVAPAYRGQGLAAAALHALTAWASGFDEIHRLQLFVEPWNEASWRVAEACGYEREGLLRGWQRVGGAWKDMYVYGLVPGRG